MKWGDIVIIVLLLGGIIGIFTSMITDSTMGDYYDEHSPSLNVSTRQTQLQSDENYADFNSSIGGQFNRLTDETTDVEDRLQAITNSEIGLLAIPGAVLSTLRVVFTSIEFTLLVGFTGTLEHIFGLEADSLNFVRHIIFWILIMVVVGAILRWKL